MKKRILGFIGVLATITAKTGIFDIKIRISYYLFFFIVINTSCGDNVENRATNLQATHPNLVATVKGMDLIKNNLGKYPLIDGTIEDMKSFVDIELKKEIDLPIPKDPSGGYTHKKHKSNYLVMFRAAMLYQVLGEKKYLNYVKKMLIGYAELFPTIGLHPNGKSYSPGKLFWQALNDAMWTVHVIQAYDCVYEELTLKERDLVESDLLKPMADFLSIGSPKMFNRVHNHGIWLNAAVGLVGYALKEDDLIKRALYGAPIDKTLETFRTVDYNDPALKGFDENRPAGYFIQLDNLFSPDGFYTEGPYYQRFSLWPIVLLAQTIENNNPEMNIFAYRNSIIKKALYTSLQLSYTNGEFFPFNDALKGMSITSPELTLALDIVYNAYSEDSALLDIAKKQNRVVFTEGGFKVAKNVKENNSKPFYWKPVNLSDGANGDKGGVGILRHGPANDQICQILRYTSHGLAHGHYDKLSQLLYDNGNEIFQDYGASRFVNVIQKRGGRYLPENTTWAKQTIAHNTLVVDEKSHFNGNINQSSKYHSEYYFYDTSKENYQLISAKENNAYPGIQMHRTMIMTTDNKLIKPFILDIFNVSSGSKHQLDLPFHYQGQIIDMSFDNEVMTNELKPLGIENGYQHLWLLGKGKAKESYEKFTWLNDDRFYTITTSTNENTELLFCRLGANDPEFNLRPDPTFIIRQKDSKNHTFVTTIEPHGSKNSVNELTSDLKGSIKKIEIVLKNHNYIAVEISLENRKILTILSLNDNNPKKPHRLNINKKLWEWEGPFMQSFVNY